MSKIITAEAAHHLMNSPAGLPVVPVPEPVWREGGPEEDQRAVLSGIWSLGGMLMRVVATAVHVDEATSCMVADDATGEDLDALWTAHGMEGHAETAQIDGRTYVIFASPFCE